MFRNASGSGASSAASFQLQNLRQFEFALEPVQRAQQILLLIGEISTQRICLETDGDAAPDTFEPLRRVVAEAWVQLEILATLPAFCACSIKSAWKRESVMLSNASITWASVCSTQVGNAVFSDDDVPQVPWMVQWPYSQTILELTSPPLRANCAGSGSIARLPAHGPGQQVVLARPRR